MDNNYQQPPVPQYNAPIPPQDDKNGLAVGSLVLGIISIVCVGWLWGVVGLILGLQAKKKKPGVKEGLATVGIVLSIIGIVAGIIASIFLIPNLLNNLHGLS
ncbi:MAG: DUF4190 domain-containing protein [Oscillospiraceae bacterium]|jgi:hypothetical protein|nr:DUF4190 domain-containing protein [Oscillospiraceae bacterium]